MKAKTLMAVRHLMMSLRFSLSVTSTLLLVLPCQNIILAMKYMCPIAVSEVQQQVRRLKSEKASGPDDVTHGIKKILPGEWILLLTTLFNNVLSSGTYPREWARAKLVTVFKRGDRKDVKNYRGINIINSIAKVCCMILCERLKQ